MIYHLLIKENCLKLIENGKKKKEKKNENENFEEKDEFDFRLHPDTKKAFGE